MEKQVSNRKPECCNKHAVYPERLGSRDRVVAKDCVLQVLGVHGDGFPLAQSALNTDASITGFAQLDESRLHVFVIVFYHNIGFVIFFNDGLKRNGDHIREFVDQDF